MEFTPEKMALSIKANSKTVKPMVMVSTHLKMALSIGGHLSTINVKGVEKKFKQMD